jgi:hypothetical protein
MTTRWTPQTEQDITAGIQTGTIRETHHMEVKATARNEAIAITIASLAIDGGTLILGIEEIEDGGRKRLSPKPVELAGQPERVDAVARNSIDPPMTVHTLEIPSEAEPTLGYLVIDIDPSPVAPHMANGAYYGRGETSRHKLSDREVRRYHQLRQTQDDLATRLLDQEEARDYLTPEQSRQGHLYLVAEPLGRIPAAGLEFLRKPREVRDVIKSGSGNMGSDTGLHPAEAGTIRERDAGTAFITEQADGPGRTPNAARYAQSFWEAGLLDIEVQRTGGIRVYLSTATEPHQDGEFLVRDGVIVTYARHLIAWLNGMAPKTGYNGHWALGLRATRLRGHRSEFRTSLARYGTAGAMDTDRYSRVTVASTRDMQDRPEDVVAALVGDLLRVLGTAGEHGFD